MKHFKLAGTIPALALVVSAGAASAASVTPDAIFGSGNANGSFTINNGIPNAGIEIGLRGKLRFNDSNLPENTFNYDGVKTYTFKAGTPPTGFGFASGAPTTPVWNFEWSINTDAGGSTGLNLDDLTYQLKLDTDPTANALFNSPFDPINLPIADHAIGSNSTGNGAGASTDDGVGTDDATEYANLIANNNVAQNSWSYEFFNGSGGPTAGFDPNVPGTYTISLFALQEKTIGNVTAPFVVASSSIDINVSPVPLPAGGILLLTALGGLGGAGALRRRRKAA